MIDPKILKAAEDMKGVVNQYMGEANKNLQKLPDGPTKDALKSLLAKARGGKMPINKVQEELQKIISNAGTD